MSGKRHFIKFIWVCPDSGLVSMCSVSASVLIILSVIKVFAAVQNDGWRL